MTPGRFWQPDLVRIVRHCQTVAAQPQAPLWVIIKNNTEFTALDSIQLVISGLFQFGENVTFANVQVKPACIGHRSEERRVGKECRSRWSPDRYKKKRSDDTAELCVRRE